MIEHGERSGEWGEVVAGDEKVVAYKGSWLGTDADRPGDRDGMSRLAVTGGAVLIVALIFLCCRLAFDGIKGTATHKVSAYIAQASDPGAPAGTGAVRSPRTRPLPAPMLPVNAPIAPVVTARLFTDPEQQGRLLDLLADCRAAYEEAGKFAPKWIQAAGENSSRVPVVNGAEKAVGTEESAAGAAPAPLSVPLPPKPIAGLTPEQWNTVDAQMTAIDSDVGLATHPALYPLPLQDMSAAVAYEMRTYLQTEREALTQSDPSKRSAIHARAETHRQQGAQILGQLESAVKGGTAPANAMGSGNGY